MSQQVPQTATPTATPAPTPPVAAEATPAPVEAKSPTGAAPTPGDAQRTQARAGAVTKPTKPVGKVNVSETPDDPIQADDKGVIHMSESAFVKRLARAKSAELQKLFGTTDVNQIIKDRQDLLTFKAQKEVQRRATLDATARLQEDLKKANENATTHKTKLDQLQHRRLVEQQHNAVQGLARKYVNEDDLGDVMFIFGRALQRMKPEDRAKVNETSIETWFKNYVTKKPAFARAGVIAKRPPTVAVSNGPGGPGLAKPTAPPSGTNPGERTFKPGQPNSMTTLEAKAAAARQGYNWLPDTRVCDPVNSSG